MFLPQSTTWGSSQVSHSTLSQLKDRSLSTFKSFQHGEEVASIGTW